MIGEVLSFAIGLKHVCNCINCGVAIVMPATIESERKRSHESFFCINGHKQYWPGKSDLELAREEAKREREQRERSEAREAALRDARNNLEHRLNGTKGALVKVQRRVKNGVCPSCNRSFDDLRQHMAGKHPDFGGATS